MTLVEDPRTGQGSGGRVFGDDLHWFVDDSGARGFDPVTDVCLGDAPLVDREWMAAVVEHAAEAIELLERIDPSGLDPATVSGWAKGVEQLRRRVDAATIAVADHIDAAQPFREQGFFTAKAWLQHHLQLSGPEAYGRVQSAKLRRAVRVWNTALAGGQVGVAQTRLMARITANPRIGSELLAQGVWQLLGDAMDLPFDEFERRALTWEKLADPLGAADQAVRNRERRHAAVQQTPDGSWAVCAVLDDVNGPEFFEVFAWYVDREFHADWADAVQRLGEGNVVVGALRRTEPQRRADALVEMARAAAACPPDRQRPLPMVNFIIDAATAEAAASNDLIDPSDYHRVVSRTDRGHRVDPNAIIEVSLWSLIRRVVTDAKGTVIDLGRASRLFTGSAREAVMLLDPTCVWPGCDQPHSWCHADHLSAWSTRGPTDSANGAPLCPRHNHHKQRGFNVHRDDHGRWHVIDPDGNDIG